MSETRDIWGRNADQFLEDFLVEDYCVECERGTKDHKAVPVRVGTELVWHVECRYPVESAGGGENE